MLYSYTARGQSGEVVKGFIENDDKIKAAKSLKEKKLIILDIKEKKSSTFWENFTFGISLKDKIIFFQQLTMMLKSGLPLVEALEALQEQTSNKQLAQINADISISIRSGKSLSESLSKHPKVFTTFFISIINSGEKSGKLDEVLDRLTMQLQKDYDIHSKVLNALLYPAFILVALIGVVLLMIIFVMPQVRGIFEEMEVELPLLTRIVLGISGVIEKWWWALGILFLLLFIVLKALMANQNIKKSWDKLLIGIPIYGKFIKKIYMANFNRNMATLISSGLPMIESINTTKGVINNVLYREALERIAKDVENGVQLSNSLKKEKIFPVMISQLVNIGERSGKLDKVLNDTADFFDREVETTTKNLTTIIEPLLTIIMGIGVALVVTAVIMPIYSLVNAI